MAAYYFSYNISWPQHIITILTVLLNAFHLPLGDARWLKPRCSRILNLKSWFWHDISISWSKQFPSSYEVLVIGCHRKRSISHMVFLKYLIFCLVVGRKLSIVCFHIHCITLYTRYLHFCDPKHQICIPGVTINAFLFYCSLHSWVLFQKVI